MDKQSPYYKQVVLLIRCLPFVSEEACFALKGGTAINLFVNDFPRLSVDIDLAYLPLDPRETALDNVRSALARITQRLNAQPNITAKLQDNKPEEMRIIVDSNQQQGAAQIKIEVSPVARGVLHEAVERDVVESVENEFGFASIQTVSLPDLYGGKLCAALDRQHPRDLYDVDVLLKTTGIDRSIFIGFIAYLLSHNRPIAEIMNPRWKNIDAVYENEFNGMTFAHTSLDELKAVSQDMLQALKSQFTQRDFDFLYSFKSGIPDWQLAPHERIQDLPAVKWKLLNINKIPADKKAKTLETLKGTMLDWLET